MNFYHIITSPLGNLKLTATGSALASICWVEDSADDTRLPTSQTSGVNQVISQAIQQLMAYFEGKRRLFNLPLLPQGSVFQQKVWQALLTIPYGETRSYGQIARQIGVENAARAVGGANHNNPLAIIIPCHRVIGSRGKLTGYAGGLGRKQKLLALEQSH